MSMMFWNQDQTSTFVSSKLAKAFFLVLRASVQPQFHVDLQKLSISTI